MCALALIIFGLISVPRMAVDLFPNVTLPTIIVATVYPGAGPEEVESEVTNVLEKQLGNINNLKNITSRSAEGVSIITLEFEWGSNLDAASSDVRDRLNMAETFLPSEVQKPFVLKLTSSLMPIMTFTLMGDIPLSELNEIAEDLTIRLQRVDGVAAVNVVGGLSKEVQINIDLAALIKNRISLDQVALALKAQNINFPVGAIANQYQKYLVRVIGQYENLDQIKNTVIGMNAQLPVLLKDIAEVSWTSQEQTNYTRTNGRNAIYLWVQKRPDANTIRVSNALKKEIEKIKSTLPPSINLRIFMDSSESIKRSINNLVTNLILGGILAIVVLFLFLGRFRATLFVAFAIPLSIFLALFLMYLFGFTINILSMAGLAIAVGMVVDNAVVVFENIYRHREQGASAQDASQIGTEEVGTAITASTLTTLAVFFPLLLISGFLRIMFKELSWAVIFSLSASLLIALTLTPMLTSKFLFISPSNTENKGFLRISENLYKKLENFYHKILSWAINHRKTIIFGILGLFLISLSIIPFLGMEFIPEQQVRFVQISFEMPKGTSLEKTNEAISKLEYYILEHWREELEGLNVQIGEATSIYQQIFGATGSNYASINLNLKKQKRWRAKEIIVDIRQKTNEIPGLVIRSVSRGGFTAMFAASPVQIEIIGHDLAVAESLNNLIISLIRNKVPEVIDLQSTYEQGNPEVQLIVDRQKASRYGLTPYQIGSFLRTQLTGYTPTYYRIQGKEYDIILRLKKEQREEIDHILASGINSPLGTVLLKNLVTIKNAVSPLYIEHKNNERIITITGDITGGSSGKIAQRVSAVLKEIAPPPGFEIRVSGAYEQMTSSFRDIGFAVLIAIILVYMVMASQFESLRDPFIILFTIPLSVIGVIWILLITNTTFSIISGIGILVLVGIVVNNGIVYITYTEQLRKYRNLGLKEAVIEAGLVRLRPILMTALTTILGLLPLSLKIGEGSEFWSPLGRAVAGGLLVATFLTLIFIPVLYVTFEHKKSKV
jgi:HAE1 family hydrophobic/amphiphilic exporter-1